MKYTKKEFVKLAGKWIAVSALSIPFVHSLASVNLGSVSGGSATTPTLQQVTDEGSVTTLELEASSFKKTGGTSSQFLKADGSVDSNEYATQFLVDTQDNLLVLTPAEYTLALGANGGARNHLYFWDSADWYKTDIPVFVKTSTPDMGAEDDSAHSGYNCFYITDKELANVWLGDNAYEIEGAIKNIDGVTSVYSEDSASYETIVKNFVLIETDSGRMLLAHQPIGYSEYLSVENEDSYDSIAPNGLPDIQGGKSDMGAEPYPQILDGGHLGGV